MIRLFSDMLLMTAFGLILTPALILYFKDIISRKEFLLARFVADVLASLGFFCIAIAVAHSWARGLDLFYAAVYARLAYQHYKAWKNANDDDDEHKKKRRSWVKNHLPKPITVGIPQPI